MELETIIIIIILVIGILFLGYLIKCIINKLSQKSPSPPSPTTKKYSCKNGKCVEDPNGNFTTPSCNSSCHPPAPPVPDSKFNQMALTAAPGTSVIDLYPFVTNSTIVNWHPGGKMTWPETKKANNKMTTSVYKDFIHADFTSAKPLACNDIERSKFLSYLQGVYYAINLNNLQSLTTDQLTALYRSLMFFFITTLETQPDGGWYGEYWKDRINDEGPNHNKRTGQTNMTATRNEVFPFDDLMNREIPKSCPAYKLTNWGDCPGHSKFFGNRIFSDPVQATMRRGMRNSPQVLAEHPPWATDGNPNPRYGVGGFPSDAFVEMLQFPQEHGAGGWPSGCDAAQAVCPLNKKPTKETFDYPPARYQPKGQSREAGGDPFSGLKPQWFYYSQGLGQFWNMGITSYCYNYIDMFLNAPLGINANSTKGGKTHPIGWSGGFAPCTDKVPFPPGGGTLGYDIEAPTEPTEHDYTNPAYSVILLLEFLSRIDVPGPCGRSPNCQSGLRDQRTGMLGIGFCMADFNTGKCPCAGETGDAFVKCLNQKGPGIGDPVTDKTGCGPDQPVSSRSDAINEQIAALMGLKKGTYFKPYAISGAPSYNLNSAPGVAGTLNQYGGFDPTPAWSAVRVKNKKPRYPARSSNDRDNSLQDNRRMICGWVNGNFYGYPKGKYISNGVPNPFEGGIPGTHPKTGEVIYGKPNTKEDPTVYYDMNGKELYSTYYGKKLEMNEGTALTLFAEFYSCGDMGFENMETNWPFGCYFGYGQALGGPGKSATKTMSQYPYGCTTVQFTCTATAYGSIVQPAYDFEVLYMPPVDSSGKSPDCTCATAVTLDLTADFGTKNAGTDLKRYVCMNKGSTGGYVPRLSPAGQSAVAFQGQYQKVTNFTDSTSNNGSFDPYTKNKFGVNSNPEPLSVCKVKDYTFDSPPHRSHQQNHHSSNHHGYHNHDYQHHGGRGHKWYHH